MSAGDVLVELDDYARELLVEYQTRAEIAAEADALRKKARDQLTAWFALKGANVGTHEGEPVARYVVVDSPRLDTEALKRGEPAIYAAYCVKPYRSEQIRVVAS
jgi:multidrug efflux pump subunit AcrA (membrane-fusion protein)